MKEKNFDVVVIGGGVTGCAIARELSRYNLNTCVVEREELSLIHIYGYGDEIRVDGTLRWCRRYDFSGYLQGGLLLHRILFCAGWRALWASDSDYYRSVYHFYQI